MLVHPLVSTLVESHRVGTKPSQSIATTLLCCSMSDRTSLSIQSIGSHRAHKCTHICYSMLQYLLNVPLALPTHNGAAHPLLSPLGLDQMCGGRFSSVAASSVLLQSLGRSFTIDPWQRGSTSPLATFKYPPLGNVEQHRHSNPANVHPHGKTLSKGIKMRALE